MYIDNITVERLQQIEQERQQTMHDEGYQRWVKELQVSSSYRVPVPIWNAQTAMQEWDITRFRIPDIKHECM